MMATLTWSGSTGYSTPNWTSFDVWGGDLKHPGREKPMPEKPKNLLLNSMNLDVKNALRKAGSIGLGLVGYTSLAVAFLKSPFWFGKQ